MQKRILIVDDEAKIRNILSLLLKDEGYKIKSVENGHKAMEVLDEFRPELILMDQNMPGMNGIETMMKIKERNPHYTIIILTAFGSISHAVDAVKKGAYDYIEKPFDNDKLLVLIRRAIEHNRMSREINVLRKQLDEKFSFQNIIGESPKIRQVLDQVQCVCQTDATVLIQGESGVGKELIAKAIHHNSNRKENNLITLNCGAIPLSLLESELFGHEKGAFTDAREQKQGTFERADKGTLFLDEIGELPLDAQVKLLRVLEEKRVLRVGGKKYIPVDVRILSATNKNLEEQVQQGNFRLDLFYRLNIFTITVPPLRERRDDIPMLVDHFIKKYNRQLKIKVENVSLAAMDLLTDFNWPGNIRDLENAVQSAMILAREGILQIEHLPLRIRGFADVDNSITEPKSGLDRTLKDLNTRVEKQLIKEALQKFSYNRTETASFLKISRKTLFNKMKMYGI